jgi:hypothetical protein
MAGAIANGEDSTKNSRPDLKKPKKGKMRSTKMIGKKYFFY